MIIGPIIPDKPSPKPVPKPTQSGLLKPVAPPNSVGPLKSGYVPISSKPQTLTVPATAPAPNFSRGEYSIVPAPKPALKPAPKPTPKPTPPVVPPVTPPAPTPKVEPTPPQASPPPPPPPPPVVKSAPIDTVEFVDESLSEEAILDLLFESIGGQEILSIARGDTINGEDVVYQPIKNINILQETYNPGNILKLQETSDRYFDNFTINLRQKIPYVGNGTKENGGTDGGNYYLDVDTGDLIVEFVNIRSDEQIEIQIATAGIIEEAGI